MTQSAFGLSCCNEDVFAGNGDIYGRIRRIIVAVTSSPDGSTVIAALTDSNVATPYVNTTKAAGINRQKTDSCTPDIYVLLLSKPETLIFTAIDGKISSIVNSYTSTIHLIIVFIYFLVNTEFPIRVTIDSKCCCIYIYSTTITTTILYRRNISV